MSDYPLGTKFVVLTVVDGEEGIMASYEPQVATIQEYGEIEDAATSNVGTYPDAEKRGKPYRVVVIPAEHFNEFEVYHEKTRGKDGFRAYPSDNPTMKESNPR